MNILIFAGVVMAVTQIIKTSFNVTKRFVPLVALFIGILFFALACLTGGTTLTYTSVIEALVSVLTALGVYSGVKTTAGY